MTNIKKITKIEIQKNNKKRFNIYLNNTYSFSVHEDTLIKHQLFKDKEVEEESLKGILIEEERNWCWQKALKYLNFKHRTTKEIKQHLIKKGFDIELIEYTINRLHKKDFINDELYTEQFIRQRIAFNPKGKKLLKMELRNKGISESTIDNSLEHIDFEQEYNLATNLIARKKSLFKGDNVNDIRRVANFLERRGFSYDVIIRIINDNKSIE